MGPMGPGGPPGFPGDPGERVRKHVCSSHKIQLPLVFVDDELWVWE